MRRTISLVSVAALLTGLGLLDSSPAGAAVCAPNQLTESTGGANSKPIVSDDGSVIGFRSDRDLTGGNADLSPEFFRYDRHTGLLQQITHTTSADTIDHLRMDADGSRLTFSTTEDGNHEIYLFDTAGPTTTQLTTTTGGLNAHPAISDDGTKIAFGSDRNLTGTNADLNREIFLIDTTGPTTTQLTTSASGTSQLPEISGDGDVVAFQSNANLTGGNADGNFEAYQVTTTSPTVTQLTNSTGSGNGGPVISADGTQVALASSRNLVPATGNADGNAEIFVIDPAGPTISQLTDTLGGSQGNPTSDASGDTLFFTSDRNLGGQNPDGGQELFRLQGGSFQTVTPAPPSVTAPVEPTVTSDGAEVTYASTGNPTGENPDGNSEIFLALCGPGTPSFVDVPTSNAFYPQIEWMVAEEIASGFPGDLFKPQDGVKRQQMANFLYNLAGQPEFTPPPNANRTFVDVPSSSPFYLAVEWMADEEIASGFPGGLFKPQDVVKRQQMANFLYNLAGQPTFTPPGSPTFADYPNGSTFSLQVEWMAATGVANGFPDGTFRPQDGVKRQQMANFLYNLDAGPGVDLD